MSKKCSTKSCATAYTVNERSEAEKIAIFYRGLKSDLHQFLVDVYPTPKTLAQAMESAYDAAEIMYEEEEDAGEEGS